MFDSIIDDISVAIARLPVLICNNCSRNFLPSYSKSLLKYFVDQARKNHALMVKIKKKSDSGRRFQYCRGANFDYDSRDYEFIPGLRRPWNDGALTPVFFNKKVLLKYINEPEYDVALVCDSYGSIYKGVAHMISFGINRNGRVITWLMDLDKLDLKEHQLHFRSYNIKSDHDIASEFYLSQIEAKYGKLSKERKLFELRSDFQIYFRSMFKLKVFRNNIHINRLMITIIRPLVWNDDGVSQVINNLNKICIEAINVKAVKRKIRALDPMLELSTLGKLKLLEHLIRLCLPTLNSRNLMTPFFVLYDLRLIVGHLIIGEKKKRIIASCANRLNINGKYDYESIYDALIRMMSRSYQQLILSCK